MQTMSNTQNREKKAAPQVARPRRLKNSAYETAKHINQVFRRPFEGWPDAPRSVRQRITLRLNRLIEETGIDAAKLTGGDAYLEAIRTLAARSPESDYRDLSYNARMVQNISREWDREATEKWRGQQGQAKPAATSDDQDELGERQKQRCILGKGWDRETSFGLHRGDTIEYVEATPEELRRGDFIAVFDTKSGMFEGNGYFEGADALAFDVQKHDGSWEYPRQGDFKIYLLLSVTRIEHFTRPQKGADASALLDGQTAAKVGRLKSRLDHLGDDITDSTQRFKIEREIYNLEREAAAAEWPEVIDELGGQR
jgi:hypothetical protein